MRTSYLGDLWKLVWAYTPRQLVAEIHLVPLRICIDGGRFATGGNLQCYISILSQPAQNWPYFLARKWPSSTVVSRFSFCFGGRMNKNGNLCPIWKLGLLQSALLSETYDSPRNAHEDEPPWWIAEMHTREQRKDVA